MPFEPGNQYASKGRPFRQALRAVLAQSPEKLRRVAEGLVEAAQAKEPWAVQMLADRLDGKAIQQVDVSGDTSLTITVARSLAERVISEQNQQLTSPVGQSMLPSQVEAGGLCPDGGGGFREPVLEVHHPPESTESPGSPEDER